jgi:two-component system, LytTR family, response regulator LytT
MILNCIAVDDEPLALGLVCKFIEQTPFLHLAGRYNSATQALKAIHDQKVDLVFLDIQMPDLNGIELARLLDGAPSHPRVIFTTAYNHFAIDGFRVDALDYLLKPFSYEEFLRAAQKGLNYAELLNRQPNPVEATQSETEIDHIFLKVEYQLVRVPLNDILYIESLKDYVKVWLEGKEKALLSLTSLKALEEKLPPKRFMRIHRSFIISLDKITSINKTAVNVGKTLSTVGDQYRDVFNEFVTRWG